MNPKFFDATYADGMFERKDGAYVQRPDNISLTAALLSNIADLERENEYMQDLSEAISLARAR